MIVSFHGHVDIVRMLIEAKAQVNTQKEVNVNVYVYTHVYVTPTTRKYTALLY